jgi:hypothetical protein
MIVVLTPLFLQILSFYISFSSRKMFLIFCQNETGYTWKKVLLEVSFLKKNVRYFSNKVVSLFFLLNLIKAGGGGSEEVGRGVNRKPRKVQGGSAKMGREGSRKSRTVPGVNAEVGRGGAGNQGRCRESMQWWAEEGAGNQGRCWDSVQR